jgi:hypothetical protein
MCAKLKSGLGLFDEQGEKLSFFSKHLLGFAHNTPRRLGI